MGRTDLPPVIDARCVPIKFKAAIIFSMRIQNLMLIVSSSAPLPGSLVVGKLVCVAFNKSRRAVRTTAV